MPLSLYQSVPTMAARTMNASAPPEEHHVNHVRDELLPTNFNATLNNIINNPPNTQANLKKLSHSQALLTEMFNYNLSLGQDRTNFLRKYTSQYGADSCDMLWCQFSHVINELGVWYHGYDNNCHTQCNINAYKVGKMLMHSVLFYF